MAKHVEISSHSPRFFRIILPEIIQNGTLELPRKFVKEHEQNLCKYARLKLPNGAVSRMEVRICNGRAWLYEGWREFVEKYSIKCGYFLVFRYKGGTRFSVRIFDLSTSEIEYSVSSFKNSNEKAVKHELIEVKEEDNVEILDERPHKVPKNMGMECTKKSREIIDSVLTRAKTFKGSNPHFTVKIQPFCISHHYLNIPSGPARTYFHQMGKKNICLKLNGDDERTWSMKYTIGSPPRSRVRIYSGWKKFSLENHLQEGDTCAFDLVNSTTFVFKVTIFRIGENWPLVMTDVASPRGKKEISNVNNLTDLERSKAFECKDPSFTILMRRSHVQDCCLLSIPNAHASRYLKDQHGKNAFLHVVDHETAWPVKCYSRHNSRLKFTSGWKAFVVDHDLQQGDACVFELFSQAPNHYNVTIFRDDP